MHVLVLGSAAGGGFPQWNCNDETTRRLRAGDPRLSPRTQSSLAVSADGRRWVLLNASPDLRQQINERRQLQPGGDDPRRSSPIAAVLLTNADVDHVAGLLTLRESHAFALYAHRHVLDVLAENSIFNVLNRGLVARRDLPVDAPTAILDAAGSPLGLWATAFAVPGKAALWREDENQPSFGTREGDTIGLAIRSADDTEDALFYIPGCAAMTGELAARLRGAQLVFFDGTLWRDDEMIVQGVGAKTGQRMGHMSCSGDNGGMAAFEPLDVRRKLFIHINNTNPMLIADSPERAEAEARGWEIAHDGMEIVL
ncbi:MAG TPA: pyrroloquinoline quinone biosynthesis protein PqqB [Rhizomicrobium sp.]|jgi:pyrroloquinoline quinone biosynthesis protein B|nr:pyrroloquinoline quinone biosynthesis protein PqqB [Rhizomicrobium sp.]